MLLGMLYATSSFVMLGAIIYFAVKRTETFEAAHRSTGPVAFVVKYSNRGEPVNLYLRLGLARKSTPRQGVLWRVLLLLLVLRLLKKITQSTRSAVLGEAPVTSSAGWKGVVTDCAPIVGFGFTVSHRKATVDSSPK